MHRTLITLLAVITLLSQWGWVEHAYHEHHANEVCEVCVSASGHVAVMPTIVQAAVCHHSDFAVPAITATLISETPRYYATRAPPRFL
jgi:hypothetical protein